MKKILVLVLAFVLIFGMIGCGGGDADVDAGGYDIAMITDLGSIDDKSFNQGTWEGIVAYAEENDITHKYYKPTEQSTDAYLAAIQLAVEGGAKIVVTPGYLFEEPVTLAQDLYPKVNFILVDGYPTVTNDNTVGIKYAEEQSGYLAGYAAVIEGYTKLGFMGGLAVPAVVRFGYGFAQGAEAAAAELGVASIDLKYHYTGGFEATPEAKALAASWYADGIEVVFACGGAVGNSVMAAAADADGKVIGVDVDQSSESDTVITSAMKGLAASVQSALAEYYDGNFPGGESLVYAADKGGVQLPMDTSKFEVFTQDDYDRVYAKLADGAIKLQNDNDVTAANMLDLSIVKVTLVE